MGMSQVVLFHPFMTNSGKCSQNRIEVSLMGPLGERYPSLVDRWHGRCSAITTTCSARAVTPGCQVNGVCSLVSFRQFQELKVIQLPHIAEYQTLDVVPPGPTPTPAEPLTDSYPSYPLSWTIIVTFNTGAMPLVNRCLGYEKLTSDSVSFVSSASISVMILPQIHFSPKYTLSFKVTNLSRCGYVYTRTHIDNLSDGHLFLFLLSTYICLRDTLSHLYFPNENDRPIPSRSIS